MQILCKCSLLPLTSFDFLHNNHTTVSKTTPFCCPFSSSTNRSLRNLVFSKKFPILRTTHFAFCSRNDVFDGFSSTRFSNTSEEDGDRENGELGLLDKPLPVTKENDESDLELEMDDAKVEKDEALAPFLKFFKGTDDGLEGGVKEEEGEVGVIDEARCVLDDEDEEERKVNVEYYEAKPGDFVVGVVVSGNENKLDVNVGADLLGTMLTKEVLPLYDKEMDYLMCDPSSDAEEFFVKGKIGVVKYDEAVSGGQRPGRPVVEPGTVLFAEVLGRTLSGRPLLSTRRLFRRIAWHRVRQIQQLNEPILVRITEWNTGGLLTRIEGLRAFLPKAELLKRVNNFSELKEKAILSTMECQSIYPVFLTAKTGIVGCQMSVLITRITEEKNDLILSEKEAWQMLYLQEGTLLEGTVRKVFPFGAQIRIGETNRRPTLRKGRPGEGRPGKARVGHPEWAAVDVGVGSVVSGFGMFLIVLCRFCSIFLIFSSSLFENCLNILLLLSGLLHISNISRGQISSVSDLLAVDEKVKVLVVKSMFPEKISLSIADLESEPGLFLTNKERVFSEAEMMAKKYRKKLPTVLATGRSKSPPTSDTLNFENEAKMYANWMWFKFERDENQTDP
ncbi:hypothetical protein L484_001787 [Morus notabilis]|uniref:30S ribosomal protein S1 n=1 Tax=Morus notabilis TaxID=981085 RepID=W9SV59_9ROSA|nr:hypothetical protein L484_001787 [Morus notabilis]